jgi:Na+/proline symporter/signal transduction histidine kinase
MTFDIDVAIVVGFLLVNLAVGLYYGRGIKTIKQYSLGGRNFNTATLSATIIATWIGGGFFASALSETYKEGLWHVFARFGDVLTLLIVGYFIAPRIKEFFGDFSVADTMGKLYGKNVRVITSISSIASTIGSVAIQIKLLSILFSYFLGFSSIYAVFISSLVVVAYSSFGGIKSVTFTDIVQFITFGIFLPGIGLIVWNTFDTPVGSVWSAIKVNPLFDYKQVFNYHDPKFYAAIALFLYYTIPGLDPATFHRILLAKDTNQVRNSFIISAILCLFVGGIACIIGMVLLSHNPNLDPDDLVMYLVNTYSYPGLKGLTLIGIMAMIMSTADSYLNSGSVIFAYDFCKSLNIKINIDRLLVARVFSLISGTFAIILALSANNLFQLLLLVGNFYTPIITMPLMLAIFGFRTTSRVVISAMLIGVLTVVGWRIFIQPIINIDSIIPGTLANLCTLFLMHYFLKEPGGWLSLKKKKNKDKVVLSIIHYIKTFEFLEYFKKFESKLEKTYIYFSGIMLLNLISSFTIDKAIYKENIIILGFLQFITLFISTSIFCNSLWPKNFKDKYTGIIWYLSVFVGLIFISSFLVLMSKFSHVSLIILTIHLSIVPLLMGWRTSLIIIVIGVGLSFSLYESYIGEMIPGELYDLKLKLIYVLLIVGSFSITLLKSKQEDFETIEKKAEHFEKETGSLKKEIEYSKREFENLSQGLKTLETQFEGKQGILKEKEMYLKDQLKIRNIEISKLKDVKDEFIRNVMHESNTPLTGILSLCDILYSYYDKLDKKNIKQSIKDIVNSGDRLKTYVNNIADLSKLSSLSYELKKEKVNLSKLSEDRTVLYKKVFSDDAKKQEFKFEIEKDIITECDEYYITQAIDNLISNAVKYGEGNPITINLIKTKDNEIQFKIIDSGVGIPENELISIFDKFTVSTKTKSSAEGRGIGLALCEKIIKVHNGRIWAKQNPDKGVCFAFTLPVASR